MRFNMVNCQILGEATPEQQARIDAGENLTRIWQGEMPQIFANMRNEPEAFVRGLADGLPGARLIRVPFNIYMFQQDGDFLPEHRRALNQMIAEGFSILWVLMDGPSQEMGDDELLAHWPDSYRDVSTEAAWRSVFTYLRTRHTQAWNKLMDWLDANPEFQPYIHGFEPINEPASYNRAGNQFPSLHDEAIEAYVNAVQGIKAITESRHPGHWFYIGGYAYSAQFDILDQTYLPSKGKTALQALRETGGSKLVWSIHLYPQWIDDSVTDMTTLRRWLTTRYKAIIGDPGVFTEYNYQNEYVNAPETNVDAMSTFLQARNQFWFEENQMGIGYWPIVNYAAGFAYRIMPDASKPGGYELMLDHQNTLGQTLATFAYANDSNWCPTGGGEFPVTIIESSSILNAVSDEDPSLNDPVDQIAFGFGGSGISTVRGLNGTNNFLVAGDGSAELFGGNSDNHLFLGRGGGIARLPKPSRYNLLQTNGGDNLLYVEGIFCEASVYYGRADLVINCRSSIYGFDPRKGDRVSFGGAFANAAALDAATRTETTKSNLTGGNDLIVNTPFGDVRFVVGSALPEPLSTYCLDFTGWSPNNADYLKYHDLNPAPKPVFSEIAGFVVDKNGTPIPVSNARGQIVGLRTVNG